MNRVEASVTPTESGPLVVLAGEADLTSINQLSAVLEAQLSGGATHLTIDVSNLRYADGSSVRKIAWVAAILRNRGGDLLLVHPSPTMISTLKLLRADDMLTIRGAT